MRKKTTKTVHWSIQGGNFNTNYTSKVEIVLPKLDIIKSVTWNFHVDVSQGKRRYNMILGHDILSKLKIYLCLSDNTIRANGSM